MSFLFSAQTNSMMSESRSKFRVVSNRPSSTSDPRNVSRGRPPGCITQGAPSVARPTQLRSQARPAINPRAIEVPMEPNALQRKASEGRNLDSQFELGPLKFMLSVGVALAVTRGGDTF